MFFGDLLITEEENKLMFSIHSIMCQWLQRECKKITKMKKRKKKKKRVNETGVQPLQDLQNESEQDRFVG